MGGFHELAPAAIASAFGFGMVLAILGSLKGNLSQKMEVSHERVSSWISQAHLILIPFVFLSGLLADHWGARGTLVAGSLLAGLGLFGLTYSRDSWMTRVGLMVVAVGTSALGVGAIVVMPRAYLGNNAASANLGLVFWSLGGLVTGCLAPLTLRRFEFHRALSIFAVASLIPAFVVTVTQPEVFSLNLQEGDPDTIWRSPTIWLVALAFLLYIPVEGSLGTWAASFLDQMGFSERRANLLVACFWMIFVASRLAAACLEYYYFHDGEAWVVIILACLTAIAIGGLAGTYHRPHAVLWLLLVGLVLGPIFPNLVAILFRNFRDGQIGTAFGTTIILGVTASLIFPPIMTVYSSRTSLRVALRLPTLISILLAGGSLALALSR